MKFTPQIELRSRKDLVNALKEKGLPSSIPTLLAFEALGVIKYPRRGLKRGTNGLDRLYTDLEIQESVAAIEKYTTERQTSFANK